MAFVFIALGSNIAPEENLKRAAELLRERWPGIRFSTVYRTKAREREDQPDFLNAAASFDSGASPSAVFASLQGIERTLGKQPPFRFGPRTIDLDFLLYDDLVLPSGDGAGFVLPHPRMHERRFVLEPLAELIVPFTEHPILRETWDALLRRTMDQDCVRTDLVL